jgi:hypothetical protein
MKGGPNKAVIPIVTIRAMKCTKFAQVNPSYVSSFLPIPRMSRLLNEGGVM